MCLTVITVQRATAQDNDNAVVPVMFNGHSFDFSRNLADGFTTFVIDEPTEYVADRDDQQPPRTEFRLLRYQDQIDVPPAVRYVSIYTADDLEGNTAYEQYEHLQTLLSERP